MEKAVNTSTKTTIQHEDALDTAARAHIDGVATADQVALLEADESEWLKSLWRLLDDAEAALENARKNVRGPERANVLNDLDDECYRIDDAITALAGAPTPEELKAPEPTKQERAQNRDEGNSKQNGRNGRKQESNTPQEKPANSGVQQLQLSWRTGNLSAWVGGHEAELGTHEQVLELLDHADGNAIDWVPGDPIKVPTVGRCDTVTVPLTDALGWLIAHSEPTDDVRFGQSVHWMGLVAATAVEHVAQGRFVMSVVAPRGGQGSKGQPFHVRWVPALTDDDVVDALIAAAPGAAMLGQGKQDPRAFTLAVLGDIVHSIVATAASGIEVPASPPNPRTRNDVGEVILAHLGGAPFTVPNKLGSDVARKLKDWAKPVTGSIPVRLIVQLDPPDESNGWFAQVLAPAERGQGVEPIEIAENSYSKTRARNMREQLDRLEMMFPALLRPGGRRRGEVILSQDEAWRLMSEDGQLLALAGFDVRVPKLATKKATASLRLTADESHESVVGAQQLANVSWSVVFDDVELTADDIARLAAEARPLVRSRGQWVEIDQVDLETAAAALAERADKTQLSGADMLRHALGLEGNPFDGGIDLAGGSWAANLLKGIDDLPEHPDTTPDGFTGELRTYQADALSWLNFLDDAGLGGCLALDMGLGKTPTTLAAFHAATEHGPGLVIAPPAVVGNWALEAAKFTPDLKVHVHHGPSRASGKKLRKIIDDNDVIITTYGTAVRDMDELADVTWGKVAIDEAQAIKNPAAETSQQLRRLDARTRVALTGTPIENGLGDLWSIMDWANPGLVGTRAHFVSQLTPPTKSESNGNTNGSSSAGSNGSPSNKSSKSAGEEALKALNGVLVYRRTKAEPEIAEELPDRIDELDHCSMTPEQIGLYQAVIDSLVVNTTANEPGTPERKGAVLAAITALKQICNHPVNYQADDEPLDNRSGKLARLNEIMESVFAADEKMLIFTHFATWGERLAEYLSERTGKDINCYHGGLSRGARDRMVDEFQNAEGAGALVLSLKAGGTGLNLTAANHVVLYDRWWNPAVEDQARDRVWRIGQKNKVICHRLVCPGTVDERVEEIVAGKRHIANMVLPKSSSIANLDSSELQQALGIDPSLLLTEDDDDLLSSGAETEVGA